MGPGISSISIRLSEETPLCESVTVGCSAIYLHGTREAFRDFADRLNQLVQGHLKAARIAEQSSPDEERPQEDIEAEANAEQRENKRNSGLDDLTCLRCHGPGASASSPLCPECAKEEFNEEAERLWEASYEGGAARCPPRE